MNLVDNISLQNTNYFEDALSQEKSEIKFLTEQEILGEGYNLFWTDLSKYYEDRESEIIEIQ